MPFAYVHMFVLQYAFQFGRRKFGRVDIDAPPEREGAYIAFINLTG